MRIKFSMIVFIAIVQTSLAQTQEAAQLLLNYEKLKQLEEILDNMYKGYKILNVGYNRIKNVAEGNFNLHQAFLDGLLAVNPSVAKYKRIAQIIRYQQLLMQEYKRAYGRFKQDPNLTASELKYLERVYSYLIKQSLRNLEELAMVVTASKLRMSDDERIKSIDRIYLDIENKVSFIRYFNNSTQLLIVQRAKDNSEVGTAKKLYDLN